MTDDADPTHAMVEVTLVPGCLHCAILRAIMASAEPVCLSDVLAALAAVAGQHIAAAPPAMRRSLAIEHGLHIGAAIQRSVERQSHRPEGETAQ